MEKVTVLWNGGWDDYLIDESTIRAMTDLEVLQFTNGPYRYFPTFESDKKTWIKAWFIGGLDSLRNQACIQVLEHLGGGD
jgi:hypothetical protein